MELPELTFRMPTFDATSRTSESPPPATKVKRNAITETERRALRKYRATGQPTPSYSVLKKWFVEEFGHYISTSTVAYCLTDKFEYLDKDDRPFAADRVKDRRGQWRSLEKCLVSWYNAVRECGGTITNATVAAQADFLWDILHEYKDLPKPKWSQSWVDGFNKRYGFKPDRDRKGPRPESERAKPRISIGSHRDKLKANRNSKAQAQSNPRPQSNPSASPQAQSSLPCQTDPPDSPVQNQVIIQYQSDQSESPVTVQSNVLYQSNLPVSTGQTQASVLYPSSQPGSQVSLPSLRHQPNQDGPQTSQPNNQYQSNQPGSRVQDQSSYRYQSSLPTSQVQAQSNDQSQSNLQDTRMQYQSDYGSQPNISNSGMQSQNGYRPQSSLPDSQIQSQRSLRSHSNLYPQDMDQSQQNNHHISGMNNGHMLNGGLWW